MASIETSFSSHILRFMGLSFSCDSLNPFMPQELFHLYSSKPCYSFQRIKFRQLNYMNRHFLFLLFSNKHNCSDFFYFISKSKLCLQFASFIAIIPHLALLSSGDKHLSCCRIIIYILVNSCSLY
jgi:hypothetical protein